MGFVQTFLLNVLIGMSMSTFFVHGYCFMGKLMAELTVSQRVRYYCEYNHNGHMTRMFPGSKIVLVDECLDCSCTMSGLHCCGFGHAGGVIGHPDDCKVLLDGCQPLLVKINNESLDCFSGKMINYTTLYMDKPHPDNLINMPDSVTVSPSVSKTTMVPSTSTSQQADKPSPIKDRVISLMELFRDIAKLHGQSKPLQPVIDTIQEANKYPQPSFVPQESTQNFQTFDQFWPQDFLLPWLFT